ncbi:PIG-L deacetylase family protein [Candidatus Latescibacterota bacterium]
MERRKFMSRTIAGSAIAGSAAFLSGPQSANATQSSYFTFANDLVIEGEVSGKPHKGKVLMAIHPHVDDVPLYCAGTVAKLIDEGYTGYLLKTTNDEENVKTTGEGVVGNDEANNEIARVLGLKKAYNIGYRKHRMVNIAVQELKMQLIFLFRLLKVNTVFCIDPWSHYDENYDHVVTAQAVEEARWHSSQGEDYPEHMKTGLSSINVNEVYWYGRGPQLVDRVVDISSYIDKKVETNVSNRVWGPSLNRGTRLRERLAKENKKLSILGNDDHTANFQFIKQFQMEGEKTLGNKFGFEYAEAYHYIGRSLSDPVIREGFTPTLEDYIDKYAEPLR